MIPDQLIGKLADVGETMFTGRALHVDVSEYYLPAFLAAGTPTEGSEWDHFVDRWVSELSAGSAKHGGWSRAGAFYVAKDFVKSEDWSKTPLKQLMDNALVFLIDSGVEGRFIPNFALPRWREIRQETLKSAPAGIDTPAESPPPDWYPDPQSRHDHRYWDGHRWTAHVANHGVQGHDPV